MITRYGDAMFVTYLTVKPVWGSRRLFSKHKTITILIFNVPVRGLCVRSEKPESFRAEFAGPKSLPISMFMNVQCLPVVHARPAQSFLSNFKA